jgi:hypothetical protein
MGFKDLCVLEEHRSPGLNQGVEGVEEDELGGHAGGISHRGAGSMPRSAAGEWAELMMIHTGLTHDPHPHPPR